MHPRRTTLAFLIALIATARWVVADAPAPPKAPTVAPRFTTKAVGGAKRDLANLLKRGPVLLDFWATWCKPCRTSMPRLQGLHRELSLRGLTVVGISVDGPGSSSRVTSF